MKIYPSLISCDILHLAETLKLLDAHCDGYHLDVMDDHFVPNLTWGPMFLNAIRKKTKRALHIHAMVDNPLQLFKRLTLQADDAFIFHYEALNNDNERTTILHEVKSKKLLAGIAISPDTPVQDVAPLLKTVDIVMIMSVYPGFSGQCFIPAVLAKIPLLLKLKNDYNLDFKISMDGGINTQTIHSITQQPVDHIAVASALFDSHDTVSALQTLYSLTSKH